MLRVRNSVVGIQHRIWDRVSSYEHVAVMQSVFQTGDVQWFLFNRYFASIDYTQIYLQTLEIVETFENRIAIA